MWLNNSSSYCTCKEQENLGIVYLQYLTALSYPVKLPHNTLKVDK